LFNKGILYAAPVAAPIKAVAKGQVVFVGQMPGYGDMIILDHGSRTHTLYAKVKEPRVQSRQLVDKGEVIGLTQEPMGERGNFYFEIRRSGKPVNPVELLP
jgi:septal ring factor EnvC (AmiA/AmiB activator)